MIDKTPLKISFIGRKQNTFSRYKRKFQGEFDLEKPRLKEKEGFARSNLIKSNDIYKSNFVMIRINPEQTKRKTLKKIQSIESKLPNTIKVINSSLKFSHYADKAKSFEQWEQSKIKCPDFILFSPWQPLNKSINLLMERLTEIGPQYVRTNNEDSGKGIFYFTKNTSRKSLKKALIQLRIRSIFNRTSNSKIISVTELNNFDITGIGHVFRAHVCGNSILGGYALVSDKKVFHANDLTIRNWESYLEYNAILQRILNISENQKKIIKAAQTLGIDIGAVEFFLIKDELHFLEINPKWGGKHSFGNEEFMVKLSANINLPQLKLVNKWLNAEEFYTKLYNEIENQFK